MNNEFKKTASKNQTVYTLESASSGGTSSGSIASSSSPIGGIQRRPGDNLIAQEAGNTVPSSTPRNFVAKNAKTSGAGAHKDKKKEQKQGTVKHKKPYMEALQAQLDQLKSKVAEGVATTMPMPDAVKLLRQYGADHFKTTSNELHFYKNGRHLSVDLVMNPDTTRSVSLSSLNAATRGLKGQGVAEGIMNTIANKVMGAAPEQPKYKVGQRVKYETSPHQPEWKDGGRGVGVITAYKNGHYMINGNPVNHFEIKGVVDQGVAEGFNGEYDDEAGMAESNLHTMARAVKGLMDTIDSNDNLPEWCQEKIAKAEMMVTGVWDYLLSQKEQGIDPEQGVAEGVSLKQKHEDKKRADQNQVRYGKMTQAEFDKKWTRTERPKPTDKEQGVAEGSESPEKEIERLKLRQDAEHGHAPLRRQAATQARIRELEKQIKGKQGVAEGSTQKYEMMLRNGQVKRFVAKDDADAKRIAAGHGAKSVIRMKGNVPGDKIGEQGVAEGKEDKIAQLKKDHNTAVHWSKNETSPQKREAARRKAETIKAHLEKQYKQGVAEGLVKDIKRLATGKDVKSRAGQEIAKSQDASMKGDTKTSKKHFDRYDKLDKLANKEQGVAEGLNDTQKKIEDTINKLEDRLKHAKSDEQWDRISARIERLQAGLKRSKQGVAEGDAYMESLHQMMERQLEPTMDLDTWVDNFQNADPQKYHQFKNKSPEKKK